MDSSSFSLTNIAAALNFFTLLSTILFLVYKKFRSHRENKTVVSSSPSNCKHHVLEENKTVASSSLDQLSLPRNLKHHVFPSFHGADVRRSFLSHIMKEFRSKAIDLFIDNNIERSKSIGPELVEAIRGSRIAIVLLSKNYASSTWCLDELVEIIKCRDVLGQTVMVLFYEVDPTDVKKQTGDFGKVFRKTCKGKTEDDIGRWKHALSEVAKVAGYHSRDWDTEAEMIETIATDVSNKLNISTPSNDFDSLVGMESHMINMRPLLRLDSEEVRILGIWGPSGIGKTTIARFLYNRHSKDFQLSVFMDNIKAKYPTPACSDEYSVKLHLQEQFMSQLINQKGFKIPHLGIVKDRLKDKKVLVVLDDVNQLVQLEAMSKETCWFGPWSRIIITTQDRKLLQAGEVNHIYKVEFPSSNEALRMFCMYAFGQETPRDGFMELVKEVIGLAGELPLGLRVMGSYFRGMSKQIWIKALPRLMTRLDGEIENVLKFSYDALCDEDKNIFLHIACFFNSETVDIVESCLAQSFRGVKQGLHVLLEKSLISVDLDIIRMHNLLVQLGREIVLRQSGKAGKRQFLDDVRDIGNVLTDDKADCSNVIGINLMSSHDNKEGIACISERAFERFSNLQFLRINGNGIKPQNLNLVCQKLRYLSWEDFPMPCFPSSFYPKFLVKLDMPFSKLERLWEGIQPLSNLKWMDLSFSESLKELPDLSTATDLCELNLSYCSSLVNIPSSVGDAFNLQKLNLSHCSSLMDLPTSIGNAINLQNLDLSYCSSLVELPCSIGNAINLQNLDLSYCSSLVKLPSSIGNAINLQNLDLSYCSSLVKLPSSIGNAVNLQKLDLSYCSSQVELPSSIWNTVKDIHFSYCSRLVELPSFSVYAINLQSLDLSYCSSLVELPFSIGNAISLRHLDLSRCSSLVKLTSSIGNLINLELLDLSYSYSLMELPSSIGNVINLKYLYLSYCCSLMELPSSIGKAINLGYLDLRHCSSLVELPSSIGNAINLQYLNLSYCSSLLKLPSSIGNAVKLQKLTLNHCSSLVELPSSMENLHRLSESSQKSLEDLNISSCSSLKCHHETSRYIEDPKLSGTAIEEVSSLMMRPLPLLSELEMSYSGIQELGPWIGRISSLRRLVLRRLKKLVSLPQLPYSLGHLDAQDCESLERLDCSFHSPDIYLNFAKCFKLNQEARDLIIHTRTSSFAVLPGGEVPACFPYRTYGSSLTVKLNQKPLRTSTKFRACIILAGEEEYESGDAEDVDVYCSITSEQNAHSVCMSPQRQRYSVLSEHLYIFVVEAVEVTSTKVRFEFELRNCNETWEIKECGIFQLLEVPSLTETHLGNDTAGTKSTQSYIGMD